MQNNQQLDLEQFIGKDVVVKGINGSLDVTCRLDGYNDFGVILTATAGKHGAATFRNRLYPWARIDYMDLVVGAEASTRVA